LRTVKTAIRILQAAHPGVKSAVRGWEFFAELLKIVGADGMSSEESDIGETENEVQKVCS
jgi:hypothetical protein